MQKQQVQIVVDNISGYPAITRDFLAKIFQMDAQEVLVTDLSTLSDFFPRGSFVVPEDASHKECLVAWDKWLEEAVRTEYGVPDARPNELLTALFDRIIAVDASKAEVPA